MHVPSAPVPVPPPPIAAPAPPGAIPKTRKAKAKFAVRKAHSLLTHFPKDPDYTVCQRSLMTRARCYNKHGVTSENTYKPTKSGDCITMDHMEIKNPVNFGRKGERVALTIVDRATKWMHVYPLISKSAQGVVARSQVSRT